MFGKTAMIGIYRRVVAVFLYNSICNIGWPEQRVNVVPAGKLLRDVYIHYNITTNTLGLGCHQCHQPQSTQSGVR